MFLASSSRLEDVIQKYLHLFERMLVVAASLNEINDIIEERMSYCNYIYYKKKKKKKLYKHHSKSNNLLVKNEYIETM